MQAAAEVPSLATSVNIGAFNFGNTNGTALDGVFLSEGFVYAVVPAKGG